MINLSKKSKKNRIIHIKRFSILLIAFLVAIQCERIDYKKIDISDGVYACFYEHFYSYGEKEFLISFLPKKSCNCMYGGYLDYKYLKHGYNLDFRIGPAYIPDDCNDPLGSPFAQCQLGALKNGKYNVSISLGTRRNKGELSISDTSYSLKMTKETNVDLIWESARRVQENSLWGGFCYSNETELQNGLILIERLVEAGAKPTSLKDGYYDFFTLNNENVDLDMSAMVPTTYFPGKNAGFVFDYDFEDSVVESIIEEFRDSSSKLYIIIETGKGSRFYNWK